MRASALRIAAARTIVILSHLAVVIGMVLIGYLHFDNIKTGIAAGVLYLLMPYTAEMTGRVGRISRAVRVSVRLLKFWQPRTIH